MVVFTCNHCGESLQKPKVAKHYDTTCRRNPINLTCVDCFIDFKLQEYVAHTKCITENDRYSAKGTASKILKGETKQTEWVNTVNLIIEQQKNARPGIRNILQGMVNYDNIPRKKAKFLNFAKNVFRFKFNNKDMEEVWNILEAHKNTLNKSKQQKVENGEGTTKEQEKTENLDESNPDKKSKKKKNKSESDTVVNGTNDDNKEEIKQKPEEISENLDESNQEKKSKKKKRKSESEGTMENGIHQEQEKTENLDESNQEKKSKKKKRKSESDTVVNGTNDGSNEEIKQEQGKIPENLDESNQEKKSKKKKRKSESEGTVENGIHQEPEKTENLDESNQDKKSKKKKRKSESEGTVENGIHQEQEKTENLDESNQDKTSKNKKKKSESEETVEIATNGVETPEDKPKKKKKSKHDTETLNGTEETPQKKQKLNETSEENGLETSSKKRKSSQGDETPETNGVDSPSKKKAKTSECETNDSKINKIDDSQNESFSFKEVILDILTKKSKGLSKEALQNKVFKKYEEIIGPIENKEILLKKYNKKLRNLKNISCDNDKYKLSNSE